MSGSAAADGPTYLSSDSVLGDRYEIRREIGRGGYSVVYAAFDRELDSEVAIKLLVPPPASAVIARERMRREVQAVRGLSHTQIVAIHDFLEEGPWSYIVMEYVAGPDLSVRVEERRPLDPEEAVRLGREIATALSAAHRRGILHRDVKPQNILIDADGSARLTDFGSAKLEGHATVTQTGGLVGTLNYTAPEVIAGERGDARSDIYALGMTLYFGLTGRLPERVSPHLPPAPAESGYHPRRVRSGIPEWLDDVIAKATTASPGNRFPTASGLADALDQRTALVAPVAAAPGGSRFDSCLICRAPEPLGLGVCPRCGGTASEVANTLIFVRRSSSTSERQTVKDGLKSLLAGRANGPDLELVAAGHRALVRVPAAGAEEVVRQLAAREIPARTAHATWSWAPLPTSFYGMLGLIVGAGSLAGAVALPSLLFVSPLVALLLTLGAQSRLGIPLVATPKRVARLPAELQEQIVTAFAGLPAGAARSLLADVVRMGQAIHAKLNGVAREGERAAQITELVSYSCEAAIDLAALDENLARLGEHRARSADLTAKWIDGVARCERTRDGLVQKLLEVITVLGQVHRQSIDSSAAHDDLAELTQEIEEQVEAHTAATQEIEELLGTNG